MTQLNFVNYDSEDTNYEMLYFPDIDARLEITFENFPDREALGLPPVPVIKTVGEYDPRDLIFQDSMGNMYELIPRRTRK